MTMKIKILSIISGLAISASFCTSANAQSFWDASISAFNDDNWNKAASPQLKRKDTIYQYDLRYGYSQGLNANSGIIYSAHLEHHDWDKYSLLDNTRFSLAIDYQHRLEQRLNAPWLFAGLVTGYHRYEDKKRRRTMWDIHTGLGQNFKQWNYLFTIGTKQQQAKQETFDQEASYFSAQINYKPTSQLHFGLETGIEVGDVASSTLASEKPAYFKAQTHDDAFLGEPWYAYRLKADTQWTSLSAGYGWHGKHEINANLQHYESKVRTRKYNGKKLQLQYTHLF